MSAPFDSLPEFSDAELIDRLVDGNLPDTERRRLLLRFESEPGGWRRCALAFLEAQAWQEAIGPLVTSTNAEPSRVRVAKAKPWRTAGRGFAVAASFLAAFVCGWLLR